MIRPKTFWDISLNHFNVFEADKACINSVSCFQWAFVSSCQRNWERAWFVYNLVFWTLWYQVSSSPINLDITTRWSPRAQTHGPAMWCLVKQIKASSPGAYFFLEIWQNIQWQSRFVNLLLLLHVFFMKPTYVVGIMSG